MMPQCIRSLEFRIFKPDLFFEQNITKIFDKVPNLSHASNVNGAIYVCKLHAIYFYGYRRKIKLT